MKKVSLILISIVGMIMLTSCGSKEQVDVSRNESSKEMVSPKDGFEDLNGNLVTRKEFKEQQKSYYDLIKQEKFFEAMDVEEKLKANAHLSGLSQEMIDEMHDNHNALVDLMEIKDKMKRAKEENQPVYEGEIIRQMDELKETKTKTKIVNELITKYDKDREKLFSELAKKPGNQRYKEGKRSDGNEDFDENGELKNPGGFVVDQDPISDESVKTSDDVYGND